MSRITYDREKVAYNPTPKSWLGETKEVDPVEILIIQETGKIFSSHILASSYEDKTILRIINALARIHQAILHDEWGLKPYHNSTVLYQREQLHLLGSSFNVIGSIQDERNLLRLIGEVENKSYSMQREQLMKQHGRWTSFTIGLKQKLRKLYYGY